MACTNTESPLKHEMSHLSTSAMNFGAKILEKNLPWLYVRIAYI